MTRIAAFRRSLRDSLGGQFPVQFLLDLAQRSCSSDSIVASGSIIVEEIIAFWHIWLRDFCEILHEDLVVLHWFICTYILLVEMVRSEQSEEVE